MKRIGTWMVVLFAASFFFAASGFADEAASESMLFSSFRAGELIDKSVKNENGEYLGTVEDLVFGEDGRVHYVIVARGGFLGIGGRLIPIPVAGTGIRHELESFIVDVSLERLEKAPYFAKGEWPDFRDANWERTVSGYYEEQAVEGVSGVAEKPGSVQETSGSSYDKNLPLKDLFRRWGEDAVGQYREHIH